MLQPGWSFTITGTWAAQQARTPSSMASGLWTALNSSPNIINGEQLRAWSLLNCPVIAFSDFPTADRVTLEKLMEMLQSDSVHFI